MGSPHTRSSAATARVLCVSNIHYRYPSGLHVLGGVDFELGHGEVIAILGPSGCGKSTLLSLIAGLIGLESGSIAWETGELERMGKTRRKLAMVFQRDTVLPWRTVEKNIQFGMECISFPKSERDAWTDILLEMANLNLFRNAYPRTLSGGMRRRVALLMALAVRPAVLLLDEPFGPLDEPTRVELTADVLKFAYGLNVSVILVTHDIGEAISISDRVLVLSNRPAKIQRIFDVDFGHDRDIVKIRETPGYAALYAELWRELWQTIRRGETNER